MNPNPTNEKAKPGESQLRGNQDRTSLTKALWSVVLVASSYYCYQYFMKPEVKVVSVNGAVSQTGTSPEAIRIHLVFAFENVGKSKTAEAALYSAFVDWSIQDKTLVVGPIDFTESPHFSLSPGQGDRFEIDKYLEPDVFARLVDAAGGIYCVVLYRWRSDNLAYLGRTFGNNVLLFMKPGIRSQVMTFDTRMVKQIYTTDWFRPERPQDQWAELMRLLSLKEIIYGDRYPEIPENRGRF